MKRADDSATCNSGLSHLVGGRLGPETAEALPIVHDAPLLDSLPVVVVCLDTLGHAVLVNTGWTELTSRPAEAEMEQGWLEAFDDRVHVQSWVTSIIADERTSALDVWVLSAPGPRLIRFAGTPRYDHKGNLQSYVLRGTDVTDLVAREDRLVHATRHDGLTGLLSREEFLDQARRWDRATLAGKPAALLFLDVDNFKTINDAAGHATGDAVLRVIGRRLQSALGTADVLARYGGDEFAALAVDVTTPSGAADVAERILAGLAEPISVRGREFTVSASIGVALVGDDQIGGWLERADAALYEAKSLGKNGFVVAKPPACPGDSPPDGVPSPLRRSVPSTALHPAGAAFHAAHFYEDDDDLLPALTGYISAGLFGDNAVVIATAKHRSELRQRLDPDLLAAARADHRYTELDAAETLARFMRNGFPDPELFRMVVGSTILRSTGRRTQVRAYGEMVALLWAEGNAAATLRLEDLWNDLQQRTAFPLLCAYPMRDFRGRPGSGYDDICNRHTQLLTAG